MWNTNELLPIGSVVLLNGGSKKVMIMGYAQGLAGSDTVRDYCAVLYPEGFMDPDSVYAFDRTEIEKVYRVGYTDRYSMEFPEYVENAIANLRNGHTEA